MSLFKDLMSRNDDEESRPVPFDSSPKRNGSLFRDLMANAQPRRAVYPTIDTRGKAPIESTSNGFDLIDALAAGVGMAEEHFGEITGLQNFTDEGRAMRERNLHQYEDNSIPYHLQNIFMSAPESLGIMAASTAAGSLIGGSIGATGGFARGLLSQAPRGASLLMNLAKAYQNGNTAGKIARTVIPANAKVASSVGIGAAMEAEVEGLEAEKRYIENAKLNGTYVEGQTEAEAKEVRSNVFRDNVGIISAFNAPQYNLIMDKPVKSLLGKLGRFGLAAGSEGAEEVAQELASAHEIGEPVQWRNIRDAGIAGFGMGGIFHGTGRLANYAANRITGQPTEEQLEALEQERKARFKEYSEKFAERYQNNRENFIQTAEDKERQSVRDGNADTNAAYRHQRRGRRYPKTTCSPTKINLSTQKRTATQFAKIMASR